MLKTARPDLVGVDKSGRITYWTGINVIPVAWNNLFFTGNEPGGVLTVEPIMTMRCKLLCTEVSKVSAQGWYTEPKQDYIYKARFVAVSGASPENKSFFASTPTAEFTLSAINGDRFVPGKEYYVDLTPAESA